MTIQELSQFYWLTREIAQKVVDGMRAEGTPFAGMLFCGMMMTASGPKVLEFNTRFGDPETQAIMVRLDSDVVDLFDAAVDGTAENLAVRMRPGASVCVILASGGYPGKVVNGKAISGLERMGEDVVVFHSGTAVKDGQLVTAGGRVLGVTATADTRESALAAAYDAVARISFPQAFYRKDIGKV